MSTNKHWNASARIAAGGQSNLRRLLEKNAWSPKPVATANPEGYWRSLQSSCAVFLSFEAQQPPARPLDKGEEARGELSPQRFGVVVDIAAWRGCEHWAGDAASQRRWNRALVAATEAQCRLRYGPEGVMAREEGEGESPLSRAMIKAISKDALALAPLLDPRYWPKAAEALPPANRFFDPETCAPSSQRGLPLIHCRFLASKPMGEAQFQQSMDAIKLKLGSFFGAERLSEPFGSSQLPGSLQWRSMLEGRSIEGHLALKQSDPTGEGINDQPIAKAVRPRL